MRGARNPNGSLTELIMDNMSHLVWGFSLIFSLNLKVSVSMHHCRPKALSIGNLSLSRSSSHRFLDLSSSGML